MKKFKNCHILYLLISVLFIAVGILFYPNLTNLGWGEKFIDLFLGVLLALYLFFMIFPELKNFNNKHNEVKVVNVLEIMVISFLTISSILSFFDIANTLSLTKTLGLAIWVRGVSLLIYVFHGRRKYFGFLDKFIFIILISLGVWVFFNGKITNEHLLLILCWALFVVAVFLIIYAIIYWPKKEVKKSNKKTKK